MHWRDGHVKIRLCKTHACNVGSNTPIGKQQTQRLVRTDYDGSDGHCSTRQWWPLTRPISWSNLYNKSNISGTDNGMLLLFQPFSSTPVHQPSQAWSSEEISISISISEGRISEMETWSLQKVETKPSINLQTTALCVMLTTWYQLKLRFLTVRALPLLLSKNGDERFRLGDRVSFFS